MLVFARRYHVSHYPFLACMHSETARTCREIAGMDFISVFFFHLSHIELLFQAPKSFCLVEVGGCGYIFLCNCQVASHAYVPFDLPVLG